MSSLPQSLYTAEQTRQLDNLIIEHYQTPAATLLKRAGNAALSLIKTSWPDAKHLLILCGTGNNGGDGFELATQALKHGYQISLIQIASDSALAKMTEETKAARNAYLKTGNPIITTLPDVLPKTDLIIDGLFGTGLNRDISGDNKTLIERTHQSNHTSVLALDIPSGLHADTGAVMGIAINASKTLSFIGLNIGLYTGQGPNHCGQIEFDDLGANPAIYQNIKASVQRTCYQQQVSQLSPRARTAHKGTHGHSLIIGGNKGFAGATRMAAEAAARVGSGLISLATHPEHAPFISLHRPELMSHGITHSEQLSPLIKQASVIAIGPGLGQDEWAQTVFKLAIASNKPLVLDADALNLLSKNPFKYQQWVLTPHPGEAARLLGVNTEEIQTDRVKAITLLQQRYGGVIVLKGAGTLIYDGKAAIKLSSYGNPGMGSGGMGDVLTGVIAGLIAQGLSPINAAQTGVILHGLAGDKAAKQDGERGLLAMDLMPHLRHLVNPII